MNKFQTGSKRGLNSKWVCILILFNIYNSKNIKLQCLFQDIDYILWTGDLPPHDVWNQTKEENLKVLQETVAQMSDMFPGVPIFPALGNHESSPVNRYAKQGAALIDGVVTSRTY